MTQTHPTSLNLLSNQMNNDTKEFHKKAKVNVKLIVKIFSQVLKQLTKFRIGRHLMLPRTFEIEKTCDYLFKIIKETFLLQSILL